MNGAASGHYFENYVIIELIKKYELLDKVKLERGNGGIVCMYEEVIPIDDMNSFIPCNLI